MPLPASQVPFVPLLLLIILSPVTSVTAPIPCALSVTVKLLVPMSMPEEESVQLLLLLLLMFTPPSVKAVKSVLPKTLECCTEMVPPVVSAPLVATNTDRSSLLLMTGKPLA